MHSYLKETRMSMTTIFLLIPLSKAAREWVSENIAIEPYQRLGANVGVEHRFIGDIVAGMQAAGLVYGSDFSVASG
jgi:hypothetical protein